MAQDIWFQLSLDFVLDIYSECGILRVGERNQNLFGAKRMTTATEKTFEHVYADAVIHDMTDEQWEAASKQRQLNWHGERMPLSEAAELYSTICDGYNKFRPEMFGMLQTEFPDAGIEVTPAREFSVAIYLHIPDAFKDRVKSFVLKHLSADEVDTVTRFTCLQPGEAELDGEALRIWWD